MEINLDNRLKTIVDLLGNQNVVVDVGCDHGLIPNYMIENSLANHVFALDISKDSLMKNIDFTKERNNINNITSLLGDGLKPMKGKRFDSVIIAGMGGELISKILKDSLDLLDEVDLVLQPMTARIILRKELEGMGFEILEERICKENGIYYEIIKARKGKPRSHRFKYEFGENLVDSKDPLLLEFIEFQKNKFLNIRNNLLNNINENTKSRINELNEKIEFYERTIYEIKSK